jgi:hypothetical protein
MTHSRKAALKAAVPIPVVIALVVSVNASAQIRLAEFEIHDRGILWETMKDDGTIGAPNPTNIVEFYPSMDWPGGPDELTTKEEQRSYNVAGGLWIAGRRDDESLLFVENGPFAFRDQGTYEEIVRTDNFVESEGFDPARAEQTITAEFTTSQGIAVKRTSHAWSFPSLADLIVIEYEFTNATGAAFSDVYFGFPYLLRPSYQDINVHNGWGDDLNRADELTGFDASRGLMYAYDDAPNFDLPTDVGNYWADPDEMRTTGYAGVAILDAPAGSDASLQPSNMLAAQLLNNESLLSLTSTTAEALYGLLSGADQSLQVGSEERVTPFMMLSCGPYDFATGASIKITVVEAVNGLPLSEAVKGLEAQDRLTAGLDSLRRTVDRAQDLYDNGLRPPGVPPPSPDIEVLPLPSSRSVSITWPALDQTWVDPVSGTTTISEYRILRSDRSFVGPYTQIQRVRPGNSIDERRFFNSETNRWGYIDQQVSLGVGYFYAVVSVDDEDHVSGLTNRNAEPLRVSSLPAENTLDVSVFPNPFRLVSGFPTTGEESTIVWTNLPESATIRIYTASGELFKVIEHDNPDSGQAIWDQVTDARQRISPGIYFWTDESDVGTAKGTLLIIK